MAQTDYSGIITVAAIAGAAWYAYEQGWLSGLFGTATFPVAVAPIVTQPVVAVPVSSPVITSTPPVLVSTTPVAVTQLLAAAGGATNLNADEWSFYWTQIGKTPIDPVTFGDIFFPSGRPADGSEPQMTAAQFVASLGSAGLSGFGWYRGIPAGLIHSGAMA